MVVRHESATRYFQRKFEADPCSAEVAARSRFNIREAIEWELRERAEARCARERLTCWVEECPRCGSRAVQREAWAEANTNYLCEWQECGSAFCPDCEEHSRGTEDSELRGDDARAWLTYKADELEKYIDRLQGELAELRARVAS